MTEKQYDAKIFDLGGWHAVGGILAEPEDPDTVAGGGRQELFLQHVEEVVAGDDAEPIENLDSVIEGYNKNLLGSVGRGAATAESLSQSSGQQEALSPDAMSSSSFAKENLPVAGASISDEPGGHQTVQKQDHKEEVVPSLSTPDRTTNLSVTPQTSSKKSKKKSDKTTASQRSAKNPQIAVHAIHDLQYQQKNIVINRNKVYPCPSGVYLARVLKKQREFTNPLSDPLMNLITDVDRLGGLKVR